MWASVDKDLPCVYACMALSGHNELWETDEKCQSFV